MRAALAQVELQRSPDLAAGEWNDGIELNPFLGSLQRSPDLAAGECIMCGLP